LAIVIITVVWIAVVWIITPPGIYEKSAAETLVSLAETLVPLAETLVPLAETTVHAGNAVKSTKSTAVEAPAVEAPEAAAVETSAAAAVETSAASPAMRPGIGKIWLAERGSAEESGCGRQGSCHPRPGSMFA
jgi:Tfp pilus assembly protein PilX